MKTVLKTSLLLGLIFLMSCKKDECIPPSIEDNFVGNWNATASFGGKNTAGDVSFYSDHTGFSPGEVFQAEINGSGPIKEFTWEMKGDTAIGIKHSANGASFTFDYDIVRSNCNTVKLNVFGVDINMYRK